MYTPGMPCFILDSNDRNISQREYHVIIVYVLQLVLYKAVTERSHHSVSTFQLGPKCVWVVVFGGRSGDRAISCTTIVELG